MRCLHCGSNAGKKRATEMSAKECLVLADDLLRLGCKFVTSSAVKYVLYRGWGELGPLR